jgi:uncharacterized protein YdaT
MPWTPASFKTRHNKGLTPAEAKKAAAIANTIIEETGDDAKAIRIANAQVKRKPKVKR